MSTLAKSLITILALTTFACTGASTGDDSGDDGFTDPGDDDGGGGGGDCEPDIVPAPAGQVCAAATRTCMEACDTEECWDTCLAADPQAENCGVCLEDGYIACVNAAGCQTQWDAVTCCFDGCADPESAACETTCAAQTAEYDTCIEAHDEACADTAACFTAT